MLFVCGLFVGAFIGVLITGLVAASRDFDRDSETSNIDAISADDKKVETVSINKDN